MKLNKTILFMKGIPFMNFLLMLVHVLLLNLGYDFHIFEVVEVCLGFYLIHLFSESLRFCLIHRLMIYYAYIVTLCIWYQRWFGFGGLRDEAHLSVLMLGIALLVYFLFSKCSNECKN